MALPGQCRDPRQRILSGVLHRQGPDGPDQERASQQFQNQRGKRDHYPVGQPGACTGPRDDRQSAAGLQLGPERRGTDAGIPGAYPLPAQQPDRFQPDGRQPAGHEQNRRVYQRSDGEQQQHHRLSGRGKYRLDRAVQLRQRDGGPVRMGTERQAEPGQKVAVPPGNVHRAGRVQGGHVRRTDGQKHLSGAPCLLQGRQAEKRDHHTGGSDGKSAG